MKLAAAKTFSGLALGVVTALALVAGCGHPTPASDAAERVAGDLAVRETDADLGKHHPRGAGWYAVQLHSHSTYSDGHESVKSMIAIAKQAGLDALAISDHDSTTQWLDPDFVAESQLLMLHSQESEGISSHNHIGLHGMTGMTPIPRGLPRDQVLAMATARGALAVINHPCNKRYPWDPLQFDSRAGAVEVWNSWYWLPDAATAAADPDHDWRSDERAIAWWVSLLDAGIRVPCVAGADFHMKPQSLASPCTLVYASSKSEKAIYEAIRAGRTVLTHDPNSPRIDVTADPTGGTNFSAMVGDTVPATARFHLHVVDGNGLTVYLNRGKTNVAKLRVSGANWTSDVTLPAGSGSAFVYARLDAFSLVGNTLRGLTSAVYLDKAAASPKAD